MGGRLREGVTLGMQSQRESDNGGVRITKGMATTGVRARGCLGWSESKTLKGDSGTLPGVETALSFCFFKISSVSDFDYHYTLYNRHSLPARDCL